MSIYIAHRRRKTSNALDTLVLSEQECFQWTSERLVTTRWITEVSWQRIPSHSKSVFYTVVQKNESLFILLQFLQMLASFCNYWPMYTELICNTIIYIPYALLLHYHGNKSTTWREIWQPWRLHPFLYLLVSSAWWDWPLTWLTKHCS